jgi:ArsR family transcriptional regulator
MENRVHVEDDLESCQIQCIHPEVIRFVRKKMPENIHLSELSEFYKLFGDSTRLGILVALSNSELCVCDLAALLRMKQSAVSHQLRILKQSRIVRSRRDGKMVYYSLEDEHIRNVLNVGLEHLGESNETGEKYSIG